MDKNLGEGLSAKCVIVPPLKCDNPDKNKKENRVSKIINEPANEKYEFDMYYRELLLAKKIMDESKKHHSKEWGESRFAGIDDVCKFKKDKNNDRDLKSCSLETGKEYLILFSNNAGCRIKQLEEGDIISFKSTKKVLHQGKIKKIVGDKLTIYVDELNKQLTINKNAVINACGPLNDEPLILAFFSSLPDIKMRFRYMIESMEFLNSVGVAHLDIKRDNIICDSNGVCRYIDFGASLILFNDNTKYFDTLCVSLKKPQFTKLFHEIKAGLLEKIAVHTPVYVAPEFELCTSIFIENMLTVDVVKQNIQKKCEIDITPEHEKIITDILSSDKSKKEFVIGMFCGDKNNLPDLMKCDVYSLGVSFKKIVKDSKIGENNNNDVDSLNDLVSKMIDPDFKKRPSFKECLKHPFFN